jgi:type I restriction enzyme R subunit
VDVPELTDRGSFREAILTNRLAAALARINLRDGQPWLDDKRGTEKNEKMRERVV